MEVFSRIIKAANNNDLTELGGLLMEHVPAMKFAATQAPVVQEYSDGTTPLFSLSTEGSVVVQGEDFIFAVNSGSETSEDQVEVEINNRGVLRMRRIPSTPVYFYHAKLATNTTHNFTYRVNGKFLGASSVAGFNELSYPLPSAKQGTWIDKFTVSSHVYGSGCENDVWVYLPYGADVTTPESLAVMVYLDGERVVEPYGAYGMRLPTVVDNLVHQAKLPAQMAHIIVSSARGGPDHGELTKLRGQAGAMRTKQYDMVDANFSNHLAREIIPAVDAKLGGGKLRTDGYSYGISGESSGGAASFKACWYTTDDAPFTRCLSQIGSFVALEHDDETGQPGSEIFPLWIRRNPKKNIRIWLSDGIEDFEGFGTDDNPFYQYLCKAGSWPLSNLAMASALKAKGYDFHFRFGKAYHNGAQAGLDLPESLAWLWRDYDPGNTSQEFEQDEAERNQPQFRFQVANRPCW